MLPLASGDTRSVASVRLLPGGLHQVGTLPCAPLSVQLPVLFSVLFLDPGSKQGFTYFIYKVHAV